MDPMVVLYARLLSTQRSCICRPTWLVVYCIFSLASLSTCHKNNSESSKKTPTKDNAKTVQA